MRRLALALVALAVSPALAGAQERQTRPNFLIVITDDQRADGMLSTMPNTRRLGRQGAKFLQAHATTPKCCPSRATFFTGRYVHNHRVTNNNVPARLNQSRTVQRYLQGRGYRTGMFGKFLNAWPAQVNPPYFHDWTTTEGGYTTATWNINGRVRRLDRYATDFISDRTVRFLRTSERDDDQPWLAWVTPFAPHQPSTPARRHRGAELPRFPMTPAIAEEDWSDKPSLLDKARGYPAVIEQVRDDGRRSLMSVDDMVGRLMDELKRLDEHRDTVFVFTSDNGFLLGEHGGLVGKDLPHPASTGIPLIVRWPGRVRPRTERRDIVANVDLASTLYAAADVRRPTDGYPLFSGRRRKTLFMESFGAKNQRGTLVIPPWFAVRTRTYRYAEYYDPQGRMIGREYYDLRSDPWELDNRIAWLTAERVEELSAQLDALARCRGRACP